MIKLIGIDLDGTLLNNEKKICRRNIESLQKAKKQGVKIVLCSGRSAEGMQRELTALNLKEAGQYGIGLNGGMIYETIDSKIIRRQLMQMETVKQLLEISRREPEEFHMQLYTGEHIYVETWCKEARYYEEETGSQLIKVDDLTPYLEKALKVVFFQHAEGDPQPGGSLDAIRVLKSRMAPQIKEGTQCVITAPFLLEFFDVSVNKGEAISRLAEHLHVDRSEVMCIGDLENDLPMLEYAGVAVAMANGSREVKEQADYITNADNNEGGVAEAVEKFVLKSL